VFIQKPPNLFKNDGNIIKKKNRLSIKSDGFTIILFRKILYLQYNRQLKKTVLLFDIVI